MAWLERASAIREYRLGVEKKFGLRARLAAKKQAENARLDFSRYRFRPVAYFYEVLKFKVLWAPIQEFIESIHSNPYKFLVKSGHKAGKTASLSGLINYWFDCFDPGIVITMGASEEAMKDTLWSEVRMQRRAAGLPECFAGPMKPELWASPNHWAKLFSVRKSESLHGKHRGKTLIIFDEATAIEKPMFTVINGIFKPEPGNAWICCYNPTDPSTPIYAEEQKESWKVFSFSSLDHPNIQMQLRARREEGREIYSDQLPIPNAVSLSMIDGWVTDWTQEIDEHTEKTITDFKWVWPASLRREPTWHRPQVDWEARCQGVWPSQENSAVWSDSLFRHVCDAMAAVPIETLPQIGCDVAGRGESGDFTAVHSRWGSLSLAHLERRGIKVTEVVGLLIETARNLAQMVNDLRLQEGNKRPRADEKQIKIVIDDDNLGCGVTDLLFEKGYNVTPIRAGTNAMDVTRYPNKRSELWFVTANRALRGGVAFSTPVYDHKGKPILDAQGKPKSVCRLDKESLKRLKLQALAPRWKLDSVGRRVVEPKDVTKERLGRSPDDMDAMNLAYYEAGWDVPSSMDIPAFDKPHLGPGHQENSLDQYRKPRRRLFGP